MRGGGSNGGLSWPRSLTGPGVGTQAERQPALPPTRPPRLEDLGSRVASTTGSSPAQEQPPTQRKGINKTPSS